MHAAAAVVRARRRHKRNHITPRDLHRLHRRTHNLLIELLSRATLTTAKLRRRAATIRDRANVTRTPATTGSRVELRDYCHSRYALA